LTVTRYLPGKGFPWGNQTSQWFALFYLDPLDRLVKEKLRIKSYIRYMDDCILVHHSKDMLHQALAEMRELVETLDCRSMIKLRYSPCRMAWNTSDGAFI
jgi:hypothetical protein